MAQSEAFAAVGRKILTAARNELYLSLPFLDAALGALNLRDDYDTPSLATEGAHLYYNGAYLAMQYERGRSRVCRAYLHLLLHCMLRHPGKKHGRDGELWDLACDIAVEHVLDSLDYRCLDRPSVSVRRQNLYRRLADEMPVPTAEAVYRALRRDALPVYDRAALAKEFLADDHALWDRTREEENERWQQLAERTQTGMETVLNDAAQGGQAVLEQLRVETREKTDYRAFLRRFAVLGEEMGVDPDAFDYGYYAYGLRQYGNLPLIEPLETRETRRVRTLVIAIDTSMSTSGDLVRGFLSYTYSILQNTESFFRRFDLRILQCDDQLRAERKITNAREMADYMEHFELIGQSATDFRPVFQRVAALQAAGELTNLRGLLYFTDGLGVYPSRRPPFDTAFVMLAGQGFPERVPPWGIRVVLDADEIELSGERL